MCTNFFGRYNHRQTSKPERPSSCSYNNLPIFQSPSTQSPHHHTAYSAAIIFQQESESLPACCRFNRTCHLKCSNLPRPAQRSFTANGTWTCSSCLNNQPRPTSHTVQPSGRPMHRSRQSLRFLQWNCCGARSKQAEIVDALRANNIDVACIQETKLRANDPTPRFVGFTSI